MPARNTVKLYLENTFYHIYNRGVEGRDIFSDDQDYKVFLSYIKRYLTKTAQNEVQPRIQGHLLDTHVILLLQVNTALMEKG